MAGVLAGCATGGDKDGDDVEALKAAGEQAVQTPAVEGSDEKRLAAALETIYAGSEGSEQLRYFSGFADLNGDGKRDAVAFVSGADRCVNGCNFYIFKREGDRFEAMTRIPMTQAPVFILDEKHHDWHDLLVTVSDAEGDDVRQRLRFADDGYIPVAQEKAGSQAEQAGQALLESLEGNGHELDPEPPEAGDEKQ